MLNQTLSNLLSNSIKFTPAGKKVYVTAEKFKEGYIEIVVKDEGIGIPEKNQDKLFRIDQKFSREGTNGEKGSGLGLALVKEIIEKHKGEVWFYSQENIGSEFHITVPEAHSIILVVENDKLFREKLIKLLKTAFPNFRILSAENGYESFGVIADKIPSVIITEHEMPLMNGVQLIDSINQKFVNNSIPFIILAKEGLSDIKSKYITKAHCDILTRPFSQDEIFERINKFLKNN